MSTCKRVLAALMIAASFVVAVPSVASARQSDDYEDGLTDAQIERLESMCRERGGRVDRGFDDDGSADMLCILPDGTWIWCVNGVGWDNWACLRIPGSPAPIGPVGQRATTTSGPVPDERSYELAPSTSWTASTSSTSGYVVVP